MKRNQKWTKRVIAGILIGMLLGGLCSCGSTGEQPRDLPNSGSNTPTAAQTAGEKADVTITDSQNLMATTTGNSVEEKEIDAACVKALQKLSLDLFLRSYADKESAEGENCMISPVSVLFALSMLANGADGETKAEMEALLLPAYTTEERNTYLYSLKKLLASTEETKLGIANSIWIRDLEGFSAVPEFLQTNADYYQAEVYKSAFDEKTLADINKWAYKNTDGMIPKVLDKIGEDTVMYLMNAIVFNGKWEHEFTDEQVQKFDFTDANGVVSEHDMLVGGADCYLSDADTDGFMLRYKGGQYAYVALLPKEDDIDAYIASLDGEKFAGLLQSADASVRCSFRLPEYESSYSIRMNSLLQEAGMEQAFSPERANFGKMATYVNGNVYVSMVLHKTFIQVNREGTKAAAVTIIGVDKCESEVPMEFREVFLQRPFVYAIIDLKTQIPVFIGTVKELQ